MANLIGTPQFAGEMERLEPTTPGHADYFNERFQLLLDNDVYLQEQQENALKIAKGKNQARIFQTTEAMQAWLSDAKNKGAANVGDNLYIVDVGVPDWWISEVLTKPNKEGYYYNIGQLEVQKVDLTEVETEIASLNEGLTDCLKSVSDGKKKVASAITAQGVNTAADAEFSIIATNITAAGTAKYNAGVTATKVGTAGTNQVLTGYTFTGAAGVNLSGIMPNRGNLNWAPGGNTSYSVPAGYYSGGTLNSAPAYSAGVSAADARANPASVNYQSGYNAGYAQGQSAATPTVQTVSATVHLVQGSPDVPTSNACNLTFSFPHGVLGLQSFSTPNHSLNTFNCRGCTVSGNTMTVYVTNPTYYDWNETITVTAAGY